MTRRASKILAVDDDEEAASLLCDALERRGYHAVPMSSAEHCLEYLRTELADVVITDVQMPGLSGIELCRELGARQSDLIVLVLTGVAQLDHAADAFRAGAYDFLTKPIRMDLVEIAIGRALEHLALRREVNQLRVDLAGDRPLDSNEILLATAMPDDVITLAELHRRYTRKVLALVGQNTALAARILGIDRSSLRLLLKSGEGLAVDSAEKSDD